MGFGKLKLRSDDRLFSVYIRKRDNYTCQRCLKRYPENSPGLHCSHYYRRRRESVRFSDDNCIALCAGCHSYWDSEKDEYRAFKIKQLGEQGFQMLTLRANQTAKKGIKSNCILIKLKIKYLEEHYI
jgi:hypothetical protein